MQRARAHVQPPLFRMCGKSCSKDKAVATSPASPVLAGPHFSELKIIIIKIAFI